jgi:hypothetical protein
MAPATTASTSAAEPPAGSAPVATAKDTTDAVATSPTPPNALAPITSSDSATSPTSKAGRRSAAPSKRKAARRSATPPARRFHTASPSPVADAASEDGPARAASLTPTFESAPGAVPAVDPAPVGDSAFAGPPSGSLPFVGPAPASEPAPTSGASEAASIASAARLYPGASLGISIAPAPLSPPQPDPSSPEPGGSNPLSKERHSLTLDQRRALRRWAYSHTVRPPHKVCIDWFYQQYGQWISQSTVSHSLSAKYARLDGDNPQLSGSRLRFGNWPDVEKLVLRWYQSVQATGRQPTNEELGEKAKQIFSQLPRYKDEQPPEFSPGWIHRFKKRYGLLIRRQRRHGDGTANVAEDIGYLADYVSRLFSVAPDTSPAAIREELLRAFGIEATLSACALARDEAIRRHSAPSDSIPPSAPPLPLSETPPVATGPLDQSTYADDDPEVVLQNALRQLQQEEAAAEEQAAVVREERERHDRANGSVHPPILSAPDGRASPVTRYATPTGPLAGHPVGHVEPQGEVHGELRIAPVSMADTAASATDKQLVRCPFCVNQRMLRTTKEAVEHMSTHVVV